jgi:hypothetical protein
MRIVADSLKLSAAKADARKKKSKEDKRQTKEGEFGIRTFS